MEFKCCSNKAREAREIEKVYRFLRLVADPNRLKIICILGNKSRCGCEITANLGISDKLVSHHIKQLKKINLLTEERRGNFIYYALDKKVLREYKKIFNRVIK